MIALFAFALLAAGTGATQDRSTTLEAIRQLENPQNLASGALGELGPYQFRKDTWAMYTKAPFSQASDPKLSEEIAIRHYEWLKARLESHGIQITPYNIALAWNGGLGSVLRGTCSSGAKDYARRAENLAQDFQHRDAAAAH